MTTFLCKVKVNGPNAAPVYKFLKSSKGGFCGSSIKWNFTKFLVGRDGRVIRRYGTATEPLSIAVSLSLSSQFFVYAMEDILIHIFCCREISERLWEKDEGFAFGLDSFIYEKRDVFVSFIVAFFVALPSYSWPLVGLLYQHGYIFFPAVAENVYIAKDIDLIL